LADTSTIISVVVPARNAAATIGRTLQALAAQRTEHAYEVIVVDSGSADTTAALVAAAGARLLHNPGGEPAGSRNLGARHARGALLAFTDADCEPEPGWLSAGIRALSGAELVQGAVRPAGEIGRYDRTVSVGGEHGLYETASLFVTRAAFERAGGFLPVPGLGVGTGRPFGEDVWFAWRVKRSGAVSTFAADAAVRHAVFPRGASEWVAERARTRYFPPLVRLVPELRDTFLWHRVFLSADSARFLLALSALAAAGASHRRAPLALALPYAVNVGREARRAESPTAAVRLAAARAAADGITAAALALGSIRSRSVVL
jgi:GT2 family glycosyltransferase